MNEQPQQNRVRIGGEDFVAERIATTEEDNHFGIADLWHLTDTEGNLIRRGLVRWFKEVGGGWGFSRGEGHTRVELETCDIIWIEVDDSMRRYLAYHQLPPSLLDLVEEIAREELSIETLKERGRDQLDFHEVGVVSLRKALQRAFMEGARHAK